VLVLTVNLEQGDLTFRTAFPILATNALGWFAGQSGELRESLAAGAVTEIPLPTVSATEILVCQTPSGKTLPLPAGVANAAVGPLDECGIWSIARGAASAAKEGTRSVPTTEVELACNLASKTESDLRVPESLLKNDAPEALVAAWLARPIWFYLVGAAWLLSFIEWFLYQRRWIS
jgi:hypothetical protein